MKTLSKSSLFQIFAIGGIVGIVAGLVHLYSGLTSEFTTIIIGDMAINMLFGVLSLIAAWLLRQGKTAVIYIVIIWIAAGVFYAFAVGRGLNFLLLLPGRLSYGS